MVQLRCYFFFFCFENAKNLGRSNDAKRRKKRGWPCISSDPVSQLYTLKRVKSASTWTQNVNFSYTEHLILARSFRFSQSSCLNCRSEWLIWKKKIKQNQCKKQTGKVSRQFHGFVH